MKFLSIDIDPVTIAVLVFMLIIIFVIAGATVTVAHVTPDGTPISTTNDGTTNDDPPIPDEPDEAYLSPRMREHILLEQARYYTDSCSAI